MTALELRQAVSPFFDETVIYAKIGEEFYPIIGSTYMHDEDGHLVLVIGRDAVDKSEVQK